MGERKMAATRVQRFDDTEVRVIYEALTELADLKQRMLDQVGFANQHAQTYLPVALPVDADVDLPTIRSLLREFER
jgi:hypothetical protein